MNEMLHPRTIFSLAVLALALSSTAGCAEDSTRGSLAAGDACTSDDECADGLSCGANNGACFGGARSERRCWPASCADDFYLREDCGEPTSRCGSVCGCAKACDISDPTNTCPSGELCIYNFGRLFDIGSRDACGDGMRCPSNNPELCGDPSKLCGPVCICTPDCSQATPSSPSDGCGGLCPEVCPIGLKGCCTQDFECADGGVCLTDPDGARTCRPAECFAQALVPPLCGTPDALCGPECPICTPQCGGMTCGPDPNCGMSCGLCGDSATCVGDAQCQPCGFELTLQGPLVEPRVSNDEPPVPEGGVLLSEPTFDLTEIIVYGQGVELPAARREAIRFFGGGYAEYVVEIPGDTTELPRRILSVFNTASLSEMDFTTSCPGEWQEPAMSFVRGFTVTETRLLLFDASTVFIFTRR